METKCPTWEEEQSDEELTERSISILLTDEGHSRSFPQSEFCLLRATTDFRITFGEHRA